MDFLKLQTQHTSTILPFKTSGAPLTIRVKPIFRCIIVQRFDFQIMGLFWGVCELCIILESFNFEIRIGANIIGVAA